MSDEREVQAVWRSGTGVAAPPTSEALRALALAVGRATRRWILLELIGGAFTAAWFLWYAATAERNMTRIGALLVVAGGAYALAHLTRRGTPRSAAVEGDGATFLRGELVRQRDLRLRLRSGYLAPLIPGVSVFYLDLILHAVSHGAGYAIGAVIVGFLALVFIVKDWQSRRNTRELQRQIDELDAVLLQPAAPVSG